MEFDVNGGLETTRLEVSLTVVLVLDVSIAGSSVSYRTKILVCVHGMWQQQEVDQMRWLMPRRKVDICGLLKVRWRGASASLVEGKDSRNKLFWVGNDMGMSGVGILLTEKLLKPIIDVKRVSFR